MPSILPQGLGQQVRYEPPHGLAFFLLELLQILEDRIVDFERDFHVLMNYKPKWSLTAASRFSMSPSDNFPKKAPIRALLTVVN